MISFSICYKAGLMVLNPFNFACQGFPHKLGWQRIHLQCRIPQLDPWVRKICWRRKGQATHSRILGLLRGSAGKQSARNAGDLGSTPGLGRSPGEGKGYPLQYSGLENPVDCIVHGVTKSRSRLSDFHFLCLSGKRLIPPSSGRSCWVLHSWLCILLFQRFKYAMPFPSVLKSFC